MEVNGANPATTQWRDSIEWKIFRIERIDTAFRPFSMDSSGILRIPITFI